ncbi:arginine deiminase family protein [Pseudalkalibacillus berkeleyi]|uniref:Arginine deiminase family protein n=1 Tax=Pseudalkalibacillus berkeleyi TaxID=1069813 RepID=A0ABS9GXT4_9BACL|nr:arginine deiminase family protein [Pseudalkalibacillus berkeleyi]MCF6136439.1 arginine deiminase family protein [Pseudalkalibacillus berkeleyi]
MLNIKPSCWSETDTLKTVIVCPPSILDVRDQQTAEDVLWEKPVNQKRATENHARLCRALEDAGVQVINYAKYLSVEDFHMNEQLLNRIYVRDLACVFGETILPGEAGISMRQPEYIHAHRLFKKWYEEPFKAEANNGLKALEFGDVMILNRDVVLINVGMRTSILSIEQVKGEIFKAGFSEIAIIDLPRRSDTLHTDMNLNLAGENMILSKCYLRYLPVLTMTEKASKHEMLHNLLKRHGFETHWTSKVTDSLADINFLNLDPETILISKQRRKSIFKDHPKLKKLKCIEVNVTELEKGGGGIRCMTLPLRRET